jgi:DNA-binding protein H-NS
MQSLHDHTPSLMPKTYSELLSQITSLQAHAEKLKSAGAEKAIATVRGLIAEYGLTAADVFGGKVASTLAKAKNGRSTAKYADGKGNTWVGVGKRPGWLRDALAGGAKLEDFLTAGSPAKSAKAAKPAKKGKRGSGKKRGRVLYKDGNNSWSGYGPKPAWFKAALASGKTEADLKA